MDDQYVDKKQVSRRIHWVAWLTAAIMTSAFAVAYLSTTPAVKVLFDNIHWTVANVGAAAMAWLGYRQAAAEARRCQYWLAWAFGIYALGQCVWDLQVVTGWNPYPAPSDLFYLAFGPLLVTGLWCGLRPHVSSGRARSLALELTVLVIQTTAVVLVLYLVRMPQVSWLQLAQLCAYPITLLGGAVVASVALLVWGRRMLQMTGLWLLLLPLGLIISGSAWMHWNFLEVTSAPTNGSWLNFTFSIGALLRGIGAAHWRMPLGQTKDDNAGLFFLLLPVLMVSAAVATVFLVLAQPQLPGVVRLYVTAGAAVVIVLSVVRQSYWLAEHEQLLRTERRVREHEQQLLVLAQRFELVASAAQIGLWDIDLRSGQAVWDAGMYRQFDRDATTAPNVYDIWRSSVHPDDRAPVRQAVRSAIRRRRNLHREYRIILPSGELRYLEAFATVKCRPDGKPESLTGISRDITERVVSRRALAESEAELRAIFENSVIGVVLIDEKRNIIRHNKAVRDFLGYDLSMASTLSAEDILHPDEQLQSRQQFAELLTGQRNAYQVERRYRHSSGDYRWVRASVYPVNLHNKRCFVVLVEDIEARKQMQMALEAAQAKATRMHEEFTYSLLNVQEQERQRIANELHDSLGQSLSVIKNRAQLALDSVSGESQAASQLQGIIRVTGDAIGETRRLAHNLRPLHLEQLGLTAALDQLLEQFQDANRIGVTWHLEDLDDAFLPAQITHIYRLVQEALNNISKHAQATQVNVLVERDLHLVRIRIEDNGRGFDTRRVREAGLGLTSMTERARMLGGSVVIKSEPDAGTAVMMELPVQEADRVARD